MTRYIASLAANVTARGVPTVRPLWWGFPADAGAVGVNDQYMLGPLLSMTRSPNAPENIECTAACHISQLWHGGDLTVV